jgi:TPP-dependent pyruvate/acetoin dehydrogenase alpha subunit
VRSTGERSVDVADHAIAYGIESRRTDGSDLLAVYETVRSAAEARRPAILEIVLADGGTEQLATLLGRGWDAAKESELRAATARELDEAVSAARGKNAPPASSIGERLFR